MSERKAQNKYYPPEWRPEMGSINKYRKIAKAKERPKDDRDPVFVIRFEMPFNIWCNGCNNHVGMGVRYNAQKKSIGHYFTTPMFKFRMKCHLCDNHFEIRTDPQNNDYVILSGARRKEERWDPKSSGAIELMDHKDRNKLETNAMFRLEHTSMDKAKAVSLEPTIKGLEDLKTVWKDDYSLNSTLRNTFRKEKEELKKIKNKESEFKKKHCLSEDLKLAPENTEDSNIVENLKLAKKSTDRTLPNIISKANRSSIFKPNKTLTKNLKSKESIKLLHRILRKS